MRLRRSLDLGPQRSKDRDHLTPKEPLQGRAVILALAIVTAVGCRQDPFEAALAETRRFRDRMCACADKACVDAVATSYRAWRTRTRASAGGERPTSGQDYQGRVLHAELEACRRTKLAPP